MLRATQDGADLTSDSIVYVLGARNLLAGRGLSRLSGIDETRPMTHFPPLYPMALAALQSLGLETLEAARLLNAAAFGMIIFLGGVAAWAVSRRPGPGFVCSLLMVTSPIFIELHSWAMTEPLYLCFSLAALLLLALSRATGQLRLLAASAVVAACVPLTRYVGVSLVAAACLALMMDGSRTWRRRVVATSLYASIALCPLGAWLVRNLLLTGGATNRQLTWHPIGLAHLKRLLAILWGWLMPSEFTYPALYATGAVLLGLMVLAVGVALRSQPRAILRRLSGLPWLTLRGLLILYILVYAMVVFVSLSFFDATIPVDQRIASPVYVSFLILGCAWLGDLWLRPARPLLRAAVVLLVATCLVSYSVRSLGLIEQLQESGRGFASEGWQSSGDVRAVRDLPRDFLIYTNNLEALEFFYGRGGTIIPFEIDAVTRLPRADYLSRREEMRQTLHENQGALVLFMRRADGTDLSLELVEGLRLIAQEHGVSVYLGQPGD